MASMLAAAIFFVGIHVLLAGTELRWKITAKIGAEVFQSIFALLSLGVSSGCAAPMARPNTSSSGGRFSRCDGWLCS